MSANGFNHYISYVNIMHMFYTNKTTSCCQKVQTEGEFISYAVTPINLDNIVIIMSKYSNEDLYKA